MVIIGRWYVQTSKHEHIGRGRGCRTMTIYESIKGSDQKYEAAINSDSFLSISAINSLLHWSSLRSPHWTLFELPILRNQSFHPLVELGQERKVSFHRSKEKFSALKGILFVSAFVKSVGSGFLNEPRHWKWGWSVGITILSANS